MDTTNTPKQPTANSSPSNYRIYEFLRDNRVGVLATVDGDSNPHAAVVYFSIDENFIVSFATKTGTRKHSNLTQNKNVMFISFDERTQTTAQITGTVEEVSEAAELEKIHGSMLDAVLLTTEDTDQPPVDILDMGKYVAYHLTPKQIRMAVFIRPNDGEDLFETIQF